MIQRSGISLSKFRSDSKGQDMIEYALMLGFLSVAAGAILPGAASSISALFSQIGSVVKTADSSSGDALKQQQPIEAPCDAGGEPAESLQPPRTCDNVSLR